MKFAKSISSVFPFGISRIELFCTITFAGAESFADNEQLDVIIQSPDVGGVHVDNTTDVVSTPVKVTSIEETEVATIGESITPFSITIVGETPLVSNDVVSSPVTVTIFAFTPIVSKDVVSIPVMDDKVGETPVVVGA